RRHFRQVFAGTEAGELRSDGAERAAVLDGAVRLRVPRVDVTGAAGHPQQDDAFGTLRLALRRRLGARSQETGDGEAREAREARLEHIAAAEDGHPFAPE